MLADTTKSSSFLINSNISFRIFSNFWDVVLYSRPIIHSILRLEVSDWLITAFSANWKFGIVANDLSNFLTTVERKPISSTIPSITPSTKIQSPTLNLFSTRTKIPEIRFLNKSWAPRATATPKSPKPAIIGPILIPQISSVAAKPKIIIRTFNARIIQFNKSLDKICSMLFINKAAGCISWWINQKIKIVTSDLFKWSIKIDDLPSNSKKLEATKNPKTIGKNFTGPSSEFVKLLSKLLVLFDTNDSIFFYNILRDYTSKK